MDLPDGGGKLLLNLVALAAECLPRGGDLSVKLDAGSAGGDSGLVLEVRVSGTDAGLREDLAEGMNDSAAIEDLTPRNVQGFFTRTLALAFGTDVEVDHPEAECLRLRVSV